MDFRLMDGSIRHTCGFNYRGIGKEAIAAVARDTNRVARDFCRDPFAD